MKYFLWIITIVAMVLLFPIPIKITLIYSEEIFTLKLYNKIIIPSKNKKKVVKKNVSLKDNLEEEKKEKPSKFKLRDIKNITDFLVTNKFKFSLRTKLDVDYSIEDAAVNAIVYGLFYQGLAVISTIFNLFFKVKNLDSCINTKYNENYFKFKSTSIIFINIAKVIYMFVSIFYRLNKGRKKSSFKKVNLKEDF